MTLDFFALTDSQHFNQQTLKKTVKKPSFEVFLKFCLLKCWELHKAKKSIEFIHNVTLQVSVEEIANKIFEFNVFTMISYIHDH